ncbi:hypothetical protein WME97_17165 [Sorangium sp. So ce367]|uniref:hypothetical protein n=1 Tax=Sorangium sp. So ce367 TaxID=3133305 RepID=UPI003F60E80C
MPDRSWGALQTFQQRMNRDIVAGIAHFSVLAVVSPSGGTNFGSGDHAGADEEQTMRLESAPALKAQ